MKRGFRGAVAFGVLGLGASLAACGLEEGATFDFMDDAGSALHDGASDADDDGGTVEGGTPDSSTPDAARALTFCDFVDAGADLVFCDDFDRDASPPGVVTVLTDGGSIVYGDSDASAPHLFATSVVNPAANSDVYAALVGAVPFADATAPDVTRVHIAYDIRVKALTLPAAGGSSVNTVIVAIEDKYAFSAPMFVKAGVPVFAFDAVDVHDGGNQFVAIGDGGVVYGEWVHVTFDVTLAADQSGTVVVSRDGVPSAPFPIHVSPLALTSNRWGVAMGMSEIGPATASYDLDNVVVTTDKR